MYGKGEGWVRRGCSWCSPAGGKPQASQQQRPAVVGLVAALKAQLFEPLLCCEESKGHTAASRLNSDTHTGA
jgi:hypothetical protein